MMKNWLDGGKDIVSSDENFELATGQTYSMMVGLPHESTYPLYGENVLDWRNPAKAHNNMPPSHNIYIRYKEGTTFSLMAARGEPLGVVNRPIPESLATVQYVQSTVPDLQNSYQMKDISESDWLLRVTINDVDVENPVLMKQRVVDFLDIFSYTANVHLPPKGFNLDKILAPILDRDLVPVNEFNQWRL